MWIKMRKLLMLLLAVTASVVLMAPSALAAPLVDSATEVVEDQDPPQRDIPEGDTPLTDAPEEDVPLTEIPEEEVPLTEIPEEDVPLTEIPEEDVPLVSAPQTGETGLNGVEALVLLTAGLAISGMAVLASAGKQKSSVR